MLEVSNLVKSYGRSRSRRSKGDDAAPAFAINDVTFEVGQGELFTLLGPSGCGKTTTLRSIAGLERPNSGTISVNGRVMFHSAGQERAVNVPANRRQLGMVFQSYAIWPHMSVFENVAYPLQIRPRPQRPGKADIEARVHRVLETMELRKYADRQATKLSGGQQQRLALARAIVIEPSLLLLDEPLSNLDAKLRESLRFELKRLQRELGITSIYVTHDQMEALALSSNIAVMNEGRVIQLGKPRDIYTNPRNRFVAEFIGTSNFIPGVVKGHDASGYTVEALDGTLQLSSGASVPTGTDVVLSVRPESIGISTERPQGVSNVWEGTVTTRAYLGDAVDHMVAVGKTEMRVRCAPSVSIEQGTRVFLHMSEETLSLVP